MFRFKVGFMKRLREQQVLAANVFKSFRAINGNGLRRYYVMNKFIATGRRGSKTADCLRSFMIYIW